VDAHPTQWGKKNREETPQQPTYHFHSKKYPNSRVTNTPNYDLKRDNTRPLFCLPEGSWCGFVGYSQENQQNKKTFMLVLKPLFPD